MDDKKMVGINDPTHFDTIPFEEPWQDVEKNTPTDDWDYVVHVVDNLLAWRIFIAEHNGNGEFELPHKRWRVTHWKNLPTRPREFLK